MQVINRNDGVELVASKYVELQVPGGGFGDYNSCKEQYNAGPEWGATFGGLGSVNTCSDLPAVLRPGCKCDSDAYTELSTYVQNSS